MHKAPRQHKVFKQVPTELTARKSNAPDGDSDSGEADLPVVTSIPAGGVVALRATEDTPRFRMAMKALLQLWHGDYMPLSGSALCMLQTALVDVDSQIVVGSLISNLLGADKLVEGSDPSKTDPRVDKALWQLCHAAGMSEVLIGQEFSDGERWQAGRLMMQPN